MKIRERLRIMKKAEQRNATRIRAFKKRKRPLRGLMEKTIWNRLRHK